MNLEILLPRRGPKFFIGISLWLLLFVFVPLSFAQKKEYSGPQELVDQSVIVLKRFMTDPQMAWLKRHLREAKAIMIVPQMIKGGFFLGGSGGSGVLLSRDPHRGWSYPAFYVLVSVSWGIQFGGEVSEALLFVRTARGVKSFLKTNVKLGGDVSIAAGPVGAKAKAQLADILVFAYSQGAFAGISIEGTVIKPRVSWNEIYYGKKVRLEDILFLYKVYNPGAETLRRLLTQYAP